MLLINKYPQYKLISDIRSGINFKRPGLHSLLELSCRRLVKEVSNFLAIWAGMECSAGMNPLQQCGWCKSSPAAMWAGILSTCGHNTHLLLYSVFFLTKNIKTPNLLLGSFHLFPTLYQFLPENPFLKKGCTYPKRPSLLVHLQPPQLCLPTQWNQNCGSLSRWYLWWFQRACRRPHGHQHCFHLLASR